MHCYVFTRDEENGIDTNIVRKTASFDLPLRHNLQHEWKIPFSSMVMTCFSSDFFIEEMDKWREDAWQMMLTRKDLRFYMVTKRPERIAQCLPEYWNELRSRVYICCTMENQRRVDKRLPIFLNLPFEHREIIVEPMLEAVDFHHSLKDINCVTVSGESRMKVRPCRYEWILDVRRQCEEAGIRFHFMQTGAYFIKDGKAYTMNHRLQIRQAAKANIDL